MDKSVVVYVTRSGHSRSLATEIGAKTGAEVFEIVDLVPRGGFFGYMRSGFQASAKRTSPIRDPFIHLENYDTVLLVQPVWASALCPPARTWLKAHAAELKGKRVALLLSNKGSDPARVRSSYEEEFGKPAALACVMEKSSPGERDATLADFLAQLGM
jgi:hypothetical protein